MGFTKTNKQLVSIAVKKLNYISPDSFIYIYNNDENIFYIVHKMENEISENNKLAQEIGKIFRFDLLEKDIKNICLIEDEDIFNENHKAFSAQPNVEKTSYKKEISNPIKRKSYKNILNSVASHAAKSGNNNKEYKYMDDLVQAS